MGVDIYMTWDNQTEEQKQAQITGFANAGAAGYLRGAYFGGYSDVLRHLFDWMDWDKPAPFNPEAFGIKLAQLKQANGERPGKGRWGYTKGADRGWDFSERQDRPVDEQALTDYQLFLELGVKLLQEGEKPMIEISY